MVVFASALAFLGISRDPAPSAYKSIERARSLECERLLGEVAEQEKRGRIKPGRPRGVYSDRDVLACRQRLLPEGLRQPGDEAILRDLEGRASRVASQVASTDGADRTWLVEAFTVNPDVGTKVAFATKAALVQEKLRVSDRVPVISAADLQVITSLPPAEAYPVACARWHATGQLRPTDVLLAMVTRHPRETNLHPGLCLDGRWSWLQ